jgi:hypothetical protein
MYRNLRALSVSTNLFSLLYIEVHLTADGTLEQYLLISFLPRTP